MRIALFARFYYLLIYSLISVLCFGQTMPKKCLPSGYIQTVGDRKLRTLWINDSKGRVIIDSIRSLDSFNFSHYTTIRYRYTNDSIIGSGNDGRNVIIKVDSNGLPITTNDTYNQLLFAVYNLDSRLQKVNKGDGTEFIDHILYANDNLVSYHENYLQAYFIVSFTYYKNRLASSVYKHQKSFALSGTRIFGSAIDVNAFSKNLLKSVTYQLINGKKKICFNYRFDKDGKARLMERMASDPENTKSLSKFVFSYSCD